MARGVTKEMKQLILNMYISKLRLNEVFMYKLRKIVLLEIKEGLKTFKYE